MENSVTTSTELVTMAVIQGIIKVVAKKNVLQTCTELIVCNTAVRIVTNQRLVTAKPVLVKKDALMDGSCLCVIKNAMT